MQIARRDLWKYLTGLTVAVPLVLKAAPAVPLDIANEDPRDLPSGGSHARLEALSELTRWKGDQPEKIGTVRDVISSFGGRPSVEETGAALHFYNGKQWDPQVEEMRLRAGRPCLVLNRLPGLATNAVWNSRLMGQVVTVDELRQAQIVLAIRNGDAQRMHNYAYSAYVELMSSQPPFILTPSGVETIL